MSDCAGCDWRPHTLVLLRHGESEWNAKNLFTGWVDVDLTAKGEAEARARRRAARASRACCPTCVHTSLLRRAIQHREIALDAADRHWIPVRRTWRLNERHYGALQGKDKKQTLEEFGEEQFMLWRRSYDIPPPPIADDDECSQVGDPRYADAAAPRCVPRTECLKDVVVPDAALLVRRDRAGPARRHDGAGRRARQLAARAGQAPGRHLRRGHRRAEHPDRHPAALRARRATCARRSPAASTSTRRPPTAAIEAVENQGR